MAKWSNLVESRGETPTEQELTIFLLKLAAFTSAYSLETT